MKGKNLIITGLVALAAGTVLILAYRSIRSTGVVFTGGILFILSGILNTFTARYGNRGRRILPATLSILASAGAVTLGICMLIFKSTFVALIPFIFGVPVAAAALYQLYLLAYGSRPAMLPGWLYMVPAALAGAAIYLFVQNPGYGDATIMLASGIALCVFGLANITEGILLGHMRRRAAIHTTPLDASPAPAAAMPGTRRPEPSDSSAAGRPAE